MTSKKNRIAIIPARSGSKRIPNKNIRDFHGVPMIARTINKLLNTDLFEEIFVSTDSKEIAEISIKYGAAVPFLREKRLADDHTPTVPVIRDAIVNLKNLGKNFSTVCCVYPCVPLLNESTLKEAVEQHKKNIESFVFPIQPFPSAPQRAFRRKINGQLESVTPNNAGTRTQELEPLFHDAGQFYIGSQELWLEKDSIHLNGIGIIVDALAAIDIDDENDWRTAEELFELRYRSAASSDQCLRSLVE